MTTLRVVRGTPDDEELAAVVAALSIVSARRARRSQEVASRPFAISAWRAALDNRHTATRAGGWRAVGGSQR